jgi:hypothetical protein
MVAEHADAAAAQLIVIEDVDARVAVPERCLR